jgi:hypothetical protein
VSLHVYVVQIDHQCVSVMFQTAKYFKTSLQLFKPLITTVLALIQDYRLILYQLSDKYKVSVKSCTYIQDILITYFFILECINYLHNPISHLFSQPQNSIYSSNSTCTCYFVIMGHRFNLFWCARK